MNNICAKAWNVARWRGGFGAVAEASDRKSLALWRRLNRGERHDVRTLVRLWLRQRH